jgi:hypothetical protein
LFVGEPNDLRQHVLVPSEGELGLDPFLQREDAQLFEALRLRPREGLVGEFPKGLSTPERERSP